MLRARTRADASSVRRSQDIEEWRVEGRPRQSANGVGVWSRIQHHQRAGAHGGRVCAPAPASDVRTGMVLTGAVGTVVCDVGVQLPMVARAHSPVGRRMHRPISRAPGRVHRQGCRLGKCANQQVYDDERGCDKRGCPTAIHAAHGSTAGRADQWDLCLVCRPCIGCFDQPRSEDLSAAYMAITSANTYGAPRRVAPLRWFGNERRQVRLRKSRGGDAASRLTRPPAAH